MRRASSSNCSATVLSAEEPPLVRARRASLRHDAACSRSSSAASERDGCRIRLLATARAAASRPRCAQHRDQQIRHEPGGPDRKTRSPP